MEVEKKIAAIIGAGLIGRAWAVVFARAGWTVRLFDAVPAQLSVARRQIEQALTEQQQAGLAADHVITEADPPLPTDIYGQSKLEAERLLAGRGVPFTVLRPAVVYGRGVKGNIASLATLAQTPMPLPFGGNWSRRGIWS